MAQDALARANVLPCMTEPCYAHVLRNLPRHAGTTPPTRAVTQNRVAIELHVNPTSFCGPRREQRVAVLKQEIVHVALRHPVRRAGRRQDLWNLACDLVANDLIGRWPLPADAVTYGMFPELRLPSEVTAEQVYARLEALVLTNNGVGATSKNAPRSAGALARAVAARSCSSGHSDHDARQGRDDKGTNAEKTAPATQAPCWPRPPRRRAPSRCGTHEREGSGRAARRDPRGHSPRRNWRATARLFLTGTGRTRLATTYRGESTRYQTTTPSPC